MRQTLSTTYRKPLAFCRLACSLPAAIQPSEASRLPQDGPRGPQEGPNRAPGRPQERPGTLQERPNNAPWCDLVVFRGAGNDARLPLVWFWERPIA
eukprot:544594-Pyramimonas_sp.AAC.1